MGKYTLSIPSKGNLTGYYAERVAEKVTATLAERIGIYCKRYYNKLNIDKQNDIHDLGFKLRYKKMPFAHIELQESSGITLIKIDMSEESLVPVYLQDDLVDSLEAALLKELVVN